MDEDRGGREDERVERARARSGASVARVSPLLPSLPRTCVLLMRLLGRYWACTQAPDGSHTSSSHTFLPRSSRTGRDEKSSCHSADVGGVEGGTDAMSKAGGAAEEPSPTTAVAPPSGVAAGREGRWSGRPAGAAGAGGGRAASRQNAPAGRGAPPCRRAGARMVRDTVYRIRICAHAERGCDCLRVCACVGRAGESKGNASLRHRSRHSRNRRGDR